MSDSEITIEKLNDRLKRVEAFLNEFIPKYDALARSHSALNESAQRKPIAYNI